LFFHWGLGEIFVISFLSFFFCLSYFLVSSFEYVSTSSTSFDLFLNCLKMPLNTSEDSSLNSIPILFLYDVRNFQIVQITLNYFSPKFQVFKSIFSFFQQNIPFDSPVVYILGFISQNIENNFTMVQNSSK